MAIVVKSQSPRPMSTASPSSDHGRSLAPVAAAFAAALLSMTTIGLIRWRSAPESTPSVVAIQIGARALELDARLLQPGSQRMGGKLERADLILGWPKFGPAPRLALDEKGRPALPSSAAHVLVSLHAADGPDPATRTLSVHGRFVEREIWSNPGGLVARRFKAGSPYEGEELAMTADGREFAARCPVAGFGRGHVAPRCLAVFRLVDIDATVSFDPSLLPEWRDLKDGVLGVLGRAIR